MKVYIQLLIAAFFAVASIITNGQVIITKSDTIPLDNDNIVKFVLPKVRGTVQWQKSLDSLNWINLEGKTNDTLTFSIDNEAVYRAVIFEGTCMPVFSDTAKLEFTVPKISTSVPQNITYNGVLIGGELVSNGGTSILEMGICYSKNENPTIEDSTIMVGNYLSSFDTTLIELVQETKYFARTYAINSKGIGYGEQVDFTTEQYTFILSKEVQTNSGDKLIAPDGTTLIIPENSFLTDGTVTFKINDYEPDIDTTLNLIQIGDIYTIKFPGDTILNNLTLKFKLPASVDYIESYCLFITNGECYYPIEYSLIGDTVVTNVDISDWLCIQTENKNAQLLAEIFIIAYLNPNQNPDDFMMNLKKININGDLDFLNPDNYLTPDKEINSKIWLFVHGWTGTPTTWEKMIPDFKEKMKDDITFWTFGYNSGLSIDENGKKLLDAVKNNSENCQIDVIAHSMGGLVSRSMLENHNGSNLTNKLVTIGTPHLGSPPAVLRNVIGYLKPWNNRYYNYNTQGVRDLSGTSIFITNLKNNLPSNRYYLISAVNDGKFIVSRLMSGPDDGIVSVKSAQGIEPNFLAPTISMGSGLVHLEMTRNDEIIQQVWGFLMAEKPTIETNLITNISQTSAISGGNITSDGGSSISARGVCWNITGNPTTADSKTNNGTGIGSFVSDMTGLTTNTIYYVRAYATNSQGTAYGEEISFTTSSGLITGTFTDDRDGHIYEWVQIGDQTWMAENLKYLPNVSPPTYGSNSEPVYYVYDYFGSDKEEAKSTTNYNKYGVLYNYHAAKTKCPNGWHLPTSEEWDELIEHLGGGSVAGGKLKAVAGWDEPNVGATNESGFSGLPGGYRWFDGIFVDIGKVGLWYKAWEGTGDYTCGEGLRNSNNLNFSSCSTSERGFSVRCVKGNRQTLGTATTSSMTNITSTSAESGGNVTSDGGSTITSRGVCWNTTGNPSITNNKTQDGSGTGSFTSQITGLTPNALYYVRAYATNSQGTAYGNEVSFTTLDDTPTLSIGDNYQGGIIAYILKSGDPGFIDGEIHGLIAAPSDQSIGIQWWNGSYLTTGATLTTIGAGNANTNTIVSIQGEGNYAAKICFDLISDEYNDWYLPSKDELNKLYINKNIIGGFSTGRYWTSTEQEFGTAWLQFFSDGGQAYTSTYATYNVRAVRTF